jgi:peptide/nickel transport system substrate-binding protein
LHACVSVGEGVLPGAAISIRFFWKVISMRNSAIRRLAGAMTMALALLVAPAVGADTLKIAVAADITSMDPHFFNLFPNNNIAEHIFDKLVQMDPDSKMIPGIATSWKTIDDRTWEFKLRRGVKFHDGSELTAEDVVFSLNRVPNVPNSPGPFTAYTKAIVATEIVDPYTLRLKYAVPYPLAPNDLSTIYIVSKKVATGATTEDFNSGKAAIGSGRFKLVRYVNGDRVELVRNDAYWGDKPVWDKVTFKIIKNEASRVAALLSGDVEAIEGVPTADLTRLKADPKFNVTSKISHRVIYFNFDHLDRVSPFITAKDGKPLAKNPLLDVRVRRAISKAINRQAIAERVMEGQAVPSGQLVSERLFGHVPALKADPYDPEGAKKLLAEAGYPDGIDAKSGTPLVLNFDVTARGPEAKSTLDWMVKQFAKLNIQLVARPTDYNRFQEKMRKGSAQIFEWGWHADYPDPENFLFLLHGPQSKVKAQGENAANYENPEFDRLFERMKNIPNSPERARIIDRMIEIARTDVPWLWGFHPKDYALHHAWYGNLKPNKIAYNTLKYQRIDPQLREKMRADWNRPVVWPIVVIFATLTLALVPAVYSYRRRERAGGRLTA